MWSFYEIFQIVENWEVDFFYGQGCCWCLSELRFIFGRVRDGDFFMEEGAVDVWVNWDLFLGVWGMVIFFVER